jgi:hypothetical protein
VWQEGRYFYPRNDDTTIDDEGVLRLNSAIQGNALIPFGRLNVADGLLRVHNAPWTGKDLSDPHITDVDYAAAGVSQAQWSDENGALTVAFLPGPLKVARTSFTVRGLEDRQEVRLQHDGLAPLVLKRGAPEAEGMVFGADGLIRISFDPRAPARFQVRAA